MSQTLPIPPSKNEDAKGTGDTPHSQHEGNDKSLLSDAKVRKYASWVAIFGTCLLGAFFSLFMIWQSLKPLPNWLLDVVQKQFGPTIGTPLSAITAFCIVTLLKATNGPIEFEALGFKFRGASGPVIMWLFCFLAMVFAMWLLWQKEMA